MPAPLTYFITFSTYGAWLHGRERGSVDKQHNQFDAPLLPPDPAHEGAMRAHMRDPPYTLGPDRRAVVLCTIREVARHRGWTFHTCHVRTTHAHTVVTADATPEKVMA